MATEQLRVIHLDSEMGWRGGQRQAAGLVKGLLKRGVPCIQVCRPGSRLGVFCRENGIPFREMSIHGEGDFVSGFRLARLARSGGFSVVHAHSAHSLSTAIWARMFNRGLKVIGSRRVDFRLRDNPFSRFKYTTGLLDMTVCVSDGVRRVMERSGVPPGKLVTIHSGIDIGKFRGIQPLPGFRETYGIPQDGIIAGTVAALAGHKDYPNLLSAAAEVLKKRKDVTFVALGGGSREQELRELASALRLGDSFRFLGFRKDALRILGHFDMFVLASRKEGLGTSILDAQALGLPVVGTDTGGIPEAVLNGVNGLLVPPRDPGRLAAAILALAGDPELRRELGEKARETVGEFSIENTVNRTLDLYVKVTGPG